MKRSCLILITVVIGLWFLSFIPSKTSGQKHKLRMSENAVPGRFIVVLNDEIIGESATAPVVEAEANFLSYVYGGQVGDVYSSALRGYAAEMSEEQAAALSQDDRVAFVEQDGVISVSATQMNAGWNLDRADQRNMPMSTTYNYTATGTGVHAYIIDTGVRWTHAEFGGRANAVYDNINDGQNGNDCNGHGTHVAGTIGSATYGVAKNVFIHSVRVMPCSGSGQISNLLAGIDWVTANHVSPAVANISITAAGSSSVLETGITNSIASGVTYAIAAGNAGADACNYTPARTPNALTVGATTATDTRAGYSNNGSCVDVFAPGSGVLSLGIASDTATGTLSGTSMAAPMVAGAAALYLQANPAASPATVSQAIKTLATSGVLTMNDTTSPNRLLYSLLTTSTSPTPTPTPTATPTPSPTPTQNLPASVRVKKRVVNASGASSITEFPYSATNLAATSFVLASNTDYVDSNVQTSGTSSTIQVSEVAVTGWQLLSVECVEASAGGTSIPDTTVDLANRKANIIAQPGETITCTFTSQPLAPTAANVSVSGRILSANGRGARGVAVSIFDSSGGVVSSTRANSFGYFTLADLPAGQSYVLVVYSNKRYTFTNNVRLLTLNESVFDLEFIADN